MEALEALPSRLLGEGGAAQAHLQPPQPHAGRGTAEWKLTDCAGLVHDPEPETLQLE